MRCVLDTNILLDALIRREPFNEKADLLLQLGFLGEFELWVGTSQLSDLVYVLTEGGKPKLAGYCREALGKLGQFVHFYATGAEDVKAVAHSTWSDLEDALVFQTALQVKADAIITRDKTGFELSHLPVFDAASFFEHVRRTTGAYYAEVEL